MKRLLPIVFWTALAVMEISCIYAWTAFTLDLFSQRPYPFLEAIFVFVIASVLTSLIRDRGWLIIHIILVHGFAIVFLVFLNIYLIQSSHENFLSVTWLEALFTRSMGFAFWTTVVTFCFFTLVSWFRGIVHARPLTTYREVCSRFDKVLTCFFALLFVKLLLRYQNGVQLTEKISDLLIFPFFFFGLLAIAIARNRSESQKHFMRGYRGIGLILSFSVAVIIGGAGLLVLLLPYLRTASVYGYKAIMYVGSPLASVFADFLLFLLSQGEIKPKNLRPPVTENTSRSIANMETIEAINNIFQSYLSILWIVLGIVIAVFVALGIWYLWRWLFSKSRTAYRKESKPNQFLVWLGRVLARLHDFVVHLFASKKAHESICLYRSLLIWGHRSGIPNRRSETPLQYGERLKRQFTTVVREIDLIVFSFNLYVYGQTLCDQETLEQTRRAIKRLRSPSLWPKRLKSWFFADGS